MFHQMTVERMTNRVWGIFSSLDQGSAGNDNRRELLKAHIASLVKRGEHNTDKLTVDGLVYLKNLLRSSKRVCYSSAISSINPSSIKVNAVTVSWLPPGAEKIRKGP